jgi:ribosomal-protein-alanine N-acetyltransferase
LQALPHQAQVYDEMAVIDQASVMNLTLRYMTLADIPQVVEIDRQSFDTPWSARSYAYEIEESGYSHMLVLEAEVVRPLNGWKRWLRPLGIASQPTAQKTILGYGGLWSISGEAHISTIATHPHWRGRGLGEILLAAMIHRSLDLDAEYIVLEVRVSNRVAQNLYHKYEFQTVERRPEYYRNNNEDAYDMRLAPLDDAMRQRFYVRWQHLVDTYQITDHYK